MNGKIYNVLFVLVFTLLLGLTAYVYLNEQQKVCYIKTSKVFNAFDMTQEMTKEMESDLIPKKNFIDSLEKEILVVKKQLNIKETDSLVKKHNYLIANFNRIKNAFQNERGERISEYQQQIWDRINQYSIDFAEENDYEIVFGANGQGGLMYAKDELDKTDEFIKYINKKYSN